MTVPVVALWAQRLLLLYFSCCPPPPLSGKLGPAQSSFCTSPCPTQSWWEEDLGRGSPVAEAVGS